MRVIQRFIILGLIFLAPSAYAARAVMEGIQTSNNTIYVDTTTTRVGVSTAIPQATLDVNGLIQTSSSVYFSVAGSSMSSKNTLQRDNFIKAWVVFSATTAVTVQAGVGVTSVTYNGVGNYMVNWSVPFASKDYAVICTGWRTSGTDGICGIKSGNATPITRGTVNISFLDYSDTPADANIINVIAIGAQ